MFEKSHMATQVYPESAGTRKFRDSVFQLSVVGHFGRLEQCLAGHTAAPGAKERRRGRQDAELAFCIYLPLLVPRSQIHGDKRPGIDATLLLRYGQAAAQYQPTTDQQQTSGRSQQGQVRDGCVGYIASSDRQGGWRQLFDRPEV